MLEWDVIIIGAGAAGLMCAIEASKRKRRVLIIDHANKPGKKILMSGGGRCNFTNLNIHPDRYISHNPHFCKSALSRYTQWHFIELVKKYQIAYHEKTLGQLFCDDKAKDILNMLLAECDKYQAKIHLNESIQQIEQSGKNHFIIKTNCQHYRCSALVVACGGLSIPTLGASPLGYQIASQFQHKVWPTRAGLVPLTLHLQDKEKYASLSGISQYCSAQVKEVSFQESLLFTHRGLSGPAILQISSYWQPADELTINLLPQVNLLAALKAAKVQSPNKSLKEYLSIYFAKKLVHAFLDLESAMQPLQYFTDGQLAQVAGVFQQWAIKPNGTEGYRTAEVTLGGVDCNALSSKTMESLSVPGLYFIGEVVDIAGWLGGYNFQWAWSSGWAAGQYV